MPGTKQQRAMERYTREARKHLARRHIDELEALDARHADERLGAFLQWKAAYDAAYPNGEEVRDD